jgi:hypothetical protein
VKMIGLPGFPRTLIDVCLKSCVHV